MNYIKSKPLSRRLVLRGIGATMALPFLEAMGAPSKSSNLATGPDGQPLRYAAIFMPNGALPGTFVPNSSNLNKLPEALAPLGEMAQHCNVVSGLETSFGGHVASTAGFLTGQKPVHDEVFLQVDYLGVMVTLFHGEMLQLQCLRKLIL